MVPGLQVTCWCALFFYLTMSVVDQCGFIPVFKMRPFEIPFRSFLESFPPPFSVHPSLPGVRLRKGHGLGVTQLQSAFEWRHTLLCVERWCWKESSFVNYASDA